jgi:hypothetical protein
MTEHKAIAEAVSKAEVYRDAFAITIFQGVKVSPKDRLGLATSTNFIFQDLGIGVGPFI